MTLKWKFCHFDKKNFPWLVWKLCLWQLLVLAGAKNVLSQMTFPFQWQEKNFTLLSGYDLSALLRLHLHSRLNSWLQWIGQRQLHDKTKNIYKFLDLVHLILEVWQYVGWSGYFLPWMWISSIRAILVMGMAETANIFSCFFKTI